MSRTQSSEMFSNNKLHSNL
uniref:Uncharacterized protein n=1 Tax=Arundo donax TaxID=35708 RepID=A0A0A8Z0Q2_ARUDO